MEEKGYHDPVKPLDIVYGYAGCHSSFANLFKEIASEKNVDIFKLIIEVSKIDRKAPSKELIGRIADVL